MRRRLGAVALALSVWLGGSHAALADTGGAAQPTSFALIVGSNVSVDSSTPALSYADDDAVLYRDLFRQLGARTYLLTRLDENTKRLHPDAIADAGEPVGVAFDQAAAALKADVARAVARHEDTVVYVVFAGHGNVRNGEGYVALEDRRITGSDLAKLTGSIPAAHIHVIVDACASFFLAFGRGPGGERRPLQPFQDSQQLANDPRVGLLLSTSSGRESHEWDAFQAGVFSHEVRSGLLGAADADGDGRVSYREIAAFVSRANAAIPNEKFRPDVMARAPHDSEQLLDLRAGLQNQVIVDGAHPWHYWLEDSKGTRRADLNNAPYQTLRIVRPAANETLYLHRVGDDTEYTLPPGFGTVKISDLTPKRERVASRGAVGEAFGLLFAMPYDESVVDAYEAPAMEAPKKPPMSPTHKLGWTSLVLGAASIGAGAAMSVIARNTADEAAVWKVPQQSVNSDNGKIQVFDSVAVGAYILGGVGIAAGIGALAWPENHSLQVGALPSGGYVGYGGTF